MPSWGAVAYGVALSVALAIVGVRLLLRERRVAVLAAAGVAAGLAPLLWDLILRHTGGRFFTDAPGLVFPVSYEDTGSGRVRDGAGCAPPRLRTYARCERTSARPDGCRVWSCGAAGRYLSLLTPDSPRFTFDVNGNRGCIF
jgi:hypothetical protein